MSQSDLARAAQVSRQTVSHWFQQKGSINLYAKNLSALAKSLGVTAEVLSNPLPVLEEALERKKWETDLLWDKLYPDLESFIGALIRGQKQALARLVQVTGLYRAEKIAGKKVWDKFPEYKALIHPASRKLNEILWKTATKFQ